MPRTLKTGDKVKWDTSQGKTVGTVKQKLTRPKQIKGHKAAASEEDPQYLVESDKSGKQAAHKPEELQPVGKTEGERIRRTRNRKGRAHLRKGSAKRGK